MLYLIGLGLNLKGISKEGLEMVGRCKKLYLDEYTVDFPYHVNELVESLGKSIELADRALVEDLSIVDEAKKKDVAILVYGSPLTATTHITLVQEAIASGVKYKIIHGASIIDAVADTGLQLYKFGKTASMPAWKESFTPTSFMELVKENQSINAHSLILIDIGLDFQDALTQLEDSAKKEKVKLDKLVVCQRLGTKNSKFFYKGIPELKEFTGVRKPYSIIIPGKLHFVEKNMLEVFS